MGSSHLRNEGASSLSKEARRRQRTSDSIARELRGMILSLDLPPGSVLTEAYLTDMLKCGRAPLREALQRLAQEHLIVSDPRRSVSVADLSIIDMVQLTELVTPLWEWVGATAAMKVTDEELRNMEAVLKDTEEAENAADITRIAELNARFHELTVRATHNHFAIDLVLPLLLLQTRFAVVELRQLGTNRSSLENHYRILDALRNRDPEEAARRSREELEARRERLRAVL